MVTEPLIYLLDMQVIIEPSNDGRTATLTVLDNDPDSRGEKAPVAGAVVRAIAHGYPVAVHDSARPRAGSRSR